jgi:hypothetical protein
MRSRGIRAARGWDTWASVPVGIEEPRARRARSSVLSNARAGPLREWLLRGEPEGQAARRWSRLGAPAPSRGRVWSRPGSGFSAPARRRRRSRAGSRRADSPRAASRRARDLAPALPRVGASERACRQYQNCNERLCVAGAITQPEVVVAVGAWARASAGARSRAPVSLGFSRSART